MTLECTGHVSKKDTGNSKNSSFEMCKIDKYTFFSYSKSTVNIQLYPIKDLKFSNNYATGSRDVCTVLRVQGLSCAKFTNERKGHGLILPKFA